ncbi:MAG: DUF3418 domain-containing protein, partial [Pseudomonadales bacterium]|nr:DUF3418 domain-containing protein [Pseudomonadales bacterium]
VEKNIPEFDRFALYYATRGSREELLGDLTEAIFRYTFIEDQAPVRTRQEFEARLSERQELMNVTNRVAALLKELLPAAIAIEEQLTATNPDPDGNARDDIRRQLQALLGPGFLRHVPLRWLKEYPRFLKAIDYRLDKLRGNSARDRANMEEFARVQARYEALDEREQELMQHYRWMIEEYRVSLFAQPLGTSMPVSGKRLDKAWADVTKQKRVSQ